MIKHLTRLSSSGQLQVNTLGQFIKAGVTKVKIQVAVSFIQMHTQFSCALLCDSVACQFRTKAVCVDRPVVARRAVEIKPLRVP